MRQHITVHTRRDDFTQASDALRLFLAEKIRHGKCSIVPLIQTSSILIRAREDVQLCVRQALTTIGSVCIHIAENREEPPSVPSCEDPLDDIG